MLVRNITANICYVENRIAAILHNFARKITAAAWYFAWKGLHLQGDSYRTKLNYLALDH